MLFAPPHVRVTAEYGTATLWLNFPGQPVNALDSRRLSELDQAIAALESHRDIGIVVVRSAKPAGFCAGLHPDAVASLSPSTAAAFAGHGQAVLSRLASLDATTVAFLDGPCLGAGLELALACDFRLVLSRPGTHLGFPGEVPPCFGGSVRIGRRACHLLESGETLSGREAKAVGLVDHAFCERRAKIELRTFLDDLERRPGRKRASSEVGFATERRSFARAVTAGASVAAWSVPELPVEVLAARGFLTPLEAEQLLASGGRKPPVESQSPQQPAHAGRSPHSRAA